MIPSDTFKFENCHISRFPSAPWKDKCQTPVAWFAENANRYVYEAAFIVAEAEPYTRGCGPWASGVYFLINGDSIVYVGKASDIPKRLKNHLDSGKVFDRYWCFGGIPEIFIEDVERFYIATIKPEYNVLVPYGDPDSQGYFGVRQITEIDRKRRERDLRRKLKIQARR